MSIQPQSLPYREGVGIMLLNHEGKIFVARRIDTRSEAWQMPQGGLDEGEEPLSCAKRELGEEIGTEKAELISQSNDWYYYDLPPDIIPRIWGGKYRGQRQKWFLMRFTGTDADINLETEHPEFCEWKWAEPQTLPALIVPFKQQLYADLLSEYGPRIVTNSF